MILDMFKAILHGARTGNGLFLPGEAHELKDLKNKQNPVITVEEAKEFVSGGQKMRYDLFRLPFNGGKGGRAEPIPGHPGTERATTSKILAGWEMDPILSGRCLYVAPAG